MEFNRNQWFFIGIFLLLLGLQFRMVTEYVLNRETTQFLAENTATDADASLYGLASDLGATPQKVIHPPVWLGWCTLSVGSVFVLQSLAMRKP
ncbi:hypothetical protein [Adhaeretor mobilis]|uniref:hypothetical protein n=1 Tax=Adhaeretor mobilis TaxID=1930276 RepID=UPI0011A0BE09|nr:hypothetical protein [Adhaeretor mobilis]